jgi:hypothetical protein
VTDGRGCKRFLAKPRDEHGIVADEIRQDDFYGVRRLKKNVAGLKNNTHSTLPKSSF